MKPNGRPRRFTTRRTRFIGDLLILRTPNPQTVNCQWRNWVSRGWRHAGTVIASPPVKPGFFIVGAPKCGTTAWVNYLRPHPQIHFAPVKEPHFFSTDLPGFQSVADLEDYLKLFAGADQGQVAAEASVMYLYSKVAAEKIRAFSPDAKIVIFLRRQEDFLPSLHHQYLYNFRESIEDFCQAWKLSGNRPESTILETCGEPKLLDYEAIGRFSEQVERYFKLFPAENIRVFHFDDWTKDPRATYLEIMGLLGIADDGRRDFPRLNEAKSHKNALLGRLIFHPPEFLKKAVRLVKRMTGRPTLRIAERAAKLIAVPGYTTSIGPEVKEEIRLHYEEDNRRLARRLWRPAKATQASS